MTDRDRDVDELFDRVLDAPPEERDAILRTREHLRPDVEALLEAHDAMGGGFLATPAGDRMQASRFEVGDRVGRYTVRRHIASGGAGDVYEAEQDQPHRTVALKVMHSWLGSDEARRRFQEEAEILARLDHPDIARVFEAGVHEDVPYIAIEYVPGAETLLHHGLGLERRARLEIFADVCDAVHHGHQQGIIHRDLKPANVLVKDGRPRVVDFGIAREPGSVEGEVAGTVAYMSPEQCEAGAHLDVRSDVYSLGVMLHELLRGELPYEVSTTSITDAARVIREVEPAPLGIAADLDAIVGKALAKDRSGRYESAAALAGDIRRYLRREPVAARRAGRIHLLALFGRRQPGLAVSLAALLLVLIAGVVVSVVFAIRADRRRAEAERETYRATVVAAAAALRVHDVEGARAQLALSPVHLRNWEWRHLSSRTDLSDRTIVWPGATIYTGTVASDRDRAAATCNAGARVWDTRTGEILDDAPRVNYLQTACALDPDGERWVIGDEKGALVIRDVASGEVLGTASVGAGIWAIACSPRGEDIAVGGVDGALTILDHGGRQRRRLTGHDGTVMSIAFAPDAREVVTGGSDGTIRFWDPAEGRELAVIDAHDENVESLAFSRDGDRLVSGCFDGTVGIWDARSREPIRLLRRQEKGVKVVAFAPDGLTFASGSLDHTLRLWHREGDEIGVLTGHTTMLRGLGFSPDSARVISFGRDETVKVWDAKRPRFVPEFAGLTRKVTQVAFTVECDVVGLAADGRAIRWDRTDATVECRFAAAGAGRLIENGTRCVTAHWKSGLTLRALDGEGEARELGRPDGFRPICLATTPDEDRVVIGEVSGRVSVWPLEGPGPTATWTAHDSSVLAVAVRPDGRVVATGHRTDPVRLWSIEDGTRIREIPGGASEVRSLAFSPDGETVAVGEQNGPILLVEAATGRIRAELIGHSQMVFNLTFSPDGTRLASASDDGTVRVWDAASGALLLVLRGHDIHATAVAWSPDGNTLASGGGDHRVSACTIRLWEAPPADGAR